MARRHLASQALRVGLRSGDLPFQFTLFLLRGTQRDHQIAEHRHN